MNPLFPSSIISKAVAAHKPITIPSAKEAKYDMMYYLRAALAGGICCGITHGMHPHHAVYLQTIAFTHTGSNPRPFAAPGPSARQCMCESVVHGGPIPYLWRRKVRECRIDANEETHQALSRPSMSSRRACSWTLSRTTRV